MHPQGGIMRTRPILSYLRYLVVVLIALFALDVHAQWLNNLNPDVYTYGNVAIGYTPAAGTPFFIGKDGVALYGTAKYNARIAPASGDRGVLLGYDTSVPGGIIAGSGVPSNLIFATNNGSSFAERMRIDPAGNVGIGTAPSAAVRLRVSGASQTSADYSFAAQDSGLNNLLVVRNDGSVGIGTSAPGSTLDVFDQTAPSAGGQRILTLESAYLGTTVGSGGRLVFKYNAGPQEVGDIRGYTFGPAATGLAFGTGFGNVQPRMVIDNAGNVGIGTVAPNQAYKLDVAGNAHFSGTVTGGNIQANYQDVAEWVPSDEELLPGTVVVLQTGQTNRVISCHEPYDTKVAGVVSAQPGILLGEGGIGKTKIATTGRVRVRVDATQSTIHIGDLLVTSDKSGMAMKSEPMEVNGRHFHQPGTILGKALEPLDHGFGEILVLLSLQ